MSEEKNDSLGNLIVSLQNKEIEETSHRPETAPTNLIQDNTSAVAPTVLNCVNPIPTVYNPPIVPMYAPIYYNQMYQGYYNMYPTNSTMNPFPMQPYFNYMPPNYPVYNNLPYGYQQTPPPITHCNPPLPGMTPPKPAIPSKEDTNTTIKKLPIQRNCLAKIPKATIKPKSVPTTTKSKKLNQKTVPAASNLSTTKTKKAPLIKINLLTKKVGSSSPISTKVKKVTSSADNSLPKVAPITSNKKKDDQKLLIGVSKNMNDGIGTKRKICMQSNGQSKYFFFLIFFKLNIFFFFTSNYKILIYILDIYKNL